MMSSTRTNLVEWNPETGAFRVGAQRDICERNRMYFARGESSGWIVLDAFYTIEEANHYKRELKRQQKEAKGEKDEG